MKILFLDIDGVLNSSRTAQAFKVFPHDFKDLEKFDKVAIALIKLLCEETESKIVLSSSWRHDFSSLQAANGLKLPILFSTPRKCNVLENPHHLRGMEIKEWLSQHPEVTKYAIVDDSSDMLEEQRDFFVHVSTAYGLSYKNYCDLHRILKD